MIIQVAKLMNSTNLNLEQDVEAMFNLEKNLSMVVNFIIFLIQQYLILILA